MALALLNSKSIILNDESIKTCEKKQNKKFFLSKFFLTYRRRPILLIKTPRVAYFPLNNIVILQYTLVVEEFCTVCSLKDQFEAWVII